MPTRKWWENYLLGARACSVLSCYRDLRARSGSCVSHRHVCVRTFNSGSDESDSESEEEAASAPQGQVRSHCLFVGRASLRMHVLSCRGLPFAVALAHMHGRCCGAPVFC